MAEIKLFFTIFRTSQMHRVLGHVRDNDTIRSLRNS